MLVRDQAGIQTLVCLILKQVPFLIYIAWSGEVSALGGVSAPLVWGQGLLREHLSIPFLIL